MRHAWIEIDLAALRHNVAAFREILSPGSKIMGIIKANAYGHGATLLAGVLRQEGITHFGVAFVQEGIELRASGVSEPILVLGYIPEEDFLDALKYNLTFTIFSLEQAFGLDKAARELERKARVHLKVDTGMGRIGFIPGQNTIDDIAKIVRLPNLEVEGIYSHQAWADNPDGRYARMQFNRFQQFLDDLLEEGIRFEKVHLANSAATINYPEMHYDLVRIGISLYGLYPDPCMAVKPKIQLKPVMSVKARLSHVKEVPEGTSISYGCTFQTTRKSIIGTIPMGYADGIPRLLSNRGEVLVKGRRCPIAGRICMDQFMVDLTDLKETPDIGDEVVYLGRQRDEEITADEIAAKVETINYEIVTCMSLRMPRIYLNEE
jgi:alanine racemase